MHKSILKEHNILVQTSMQYRHLNINRLSQKDCLFLIIIAVNLTEEPRYITWYCCLRATHKSGESAFETGKVPLRLHPIYNHISEFIKGRLNHREVWSNLLMFHPLQFDKLWETMRNSMFAVCLVCPNPSQWAVVFHPASQNLALLCNKPTFFRLHLMPPKLGSFKFSGMAWEQVRFFTRPRFWTLLFTVVFTTCLSYCIFRAPSTVLNVPT